MKEMKTVLVDRRVAEAMLLLAGLLTSMAQEKPAKDDAAPKASKVGKSKSEEPDKGAPEPALPDTPQGLGGFGKVLPLGEKNIDVKIPSFRDGMPSSTVRAGSMTRVDADNMVMEKMDIRLFGDPKAADPRSQDVRVQLITAIYHMPSQILTSDQRSRVSRQDFDLQGDSMIFDTKTQQGKMVGNVHMVIYDADSLLSKSSDPESKPKPGEATPPAVSTPKSQPTLPPANEKK